MSYESQIVRELDIAEADKESLTAALAWSVAAFAASATNLLQAQESGSTTAKKLRTLLDETLQPGSPLKLRDTARVGEIVGKYRANPGRLAVVCEDLDTRHWLARALQVALDFDRYPSHGVYPVKADPDESEAGEIIVVAPDNPLVKLYPRSLVFLAA